MRLQVRVVVGGRIRVARCERHPAYFVLAGEGYERDEGWRVNGLRVDAVWNPVPLIADIHPAPVVIWSVAPGLVRDPGQTVWVVHLPVALLVWCPASIYARLPDVAIVAKVLPVTILIQIPYP